MMDYFLKQNYYLNWKNEKFLINFIKITMDKKELENLLIKDLWKEILEFEGKNSKVIISIADKLKMDKNKLY